MIDWKPIDEEAKSLGELLLVDADGRVYLGSWRSDDNYPDEPPLWLDNSYDDFSTGYCSLPIEPTHYAIITKPGE